MDPVTGHHPTQKKKLEKVSKLPHYSSNRPSQQSNAKRRKPEAEKIIAEEQAGFRPGRRTVEQICTIKILMENLQHQQERHHIFIDFKKASDRVWHEALWLI
ncbi:endonuclease-reverse transcriptase [Elysia marginata]|uniref:Endonuclease-reverse transcriptase n=1 Tax=Elysia marginata TaxID=1093978 RepID=A0AAV4H664_9GAST|nr:endonuclease-reverse transcriptase [Elysia marginata]